LAYGRVRSGVIDRLAVVGLPQTGGWGPRDRGDRDGGITNKIYFLQNCKQQKKFYFLQNITKAGILPP
jgi:hypothetical protein